MSSEDRKIDVSIDFGKGQEEASSNPAPNAAPAESPSGGSDQLLGKGLDVGTANLLSAVQGPDGQTIIKAQRNAFIDIDSDDFTRNMLTKLNIQYVVVNNRMLVIGDPAFDLANVLNKETRRPMQHGLISPNEVDALPIEKLLLESVLGRPNAPKEVVYFSVPADPIDSEANVIYHRGLFEGILKKMGYNGKPLLEGHAVVFAEMADLDFSGIGISCGGGMFNICVSYKTIPCLSFSTSRGGDWIDTNVAKVLGIKSSRATAIKEKGVDITKPKNREEEAIEIYYRNLVEYTLSNIKKRFESSEGMPNFPDPVDIVFAGGTSLIGGFTETVKDVLAGMEFPIPIREVRRAEDALTSVCRGALVAAVSED